MKQILVEIGVEEIPARLLEPALAELEEKLSDWVNEENIDPDYPGSETELKVEGTPRRILIDLRLPDRQADREEVLKGPPAHIAYDDGEPTAALEGFCRQNDLTLEEVKVEERADGEYVMAVKTIEGQPVEQRFAADFPEILFSLDWGKTMRWEQSGTRFIRPLRWLLALLDDELLDLQVGPLKAAATSRGLRFSEADQFEVESAQDYYEKMAEQGIVLSSRDRKNLIREAARELADEVGGRPVIEPDLLEEVAGLVEAPVPFLGNFEDKFLELPVPVLTETMVAHQKYIPVAASEDGELLPYFIGVRNGGEKGLDVVRRGNERVIRARLADAVFFYRKDLEGDFEKFREELRGVVFQEKLGSLHEKTERLASLFKQLSDCSEKFLPAVRHCKNDRVTEVVGELPKLQGIMGRIYAREAGWSAELSRVIEEHYRPENPEDAIPDGKPACWLSLLDRLDTMVGLFALGERPTGSSDPYGLRRDALAVLKIIMGAELEVDLEKVATVVAEEYERSGVEVSTEVLSELKDFILDRFYHYLRSEKDFEEEEVRAVLEPFGLQPATAVCRAGWLRRWGEKPEFEEVATTARRLVNITPEESPSDPDPELFEAKEEKELWSTYQEQKKPLQRALKESTPSQILEALIVLKEPVDQYFETVMVNCDDTAQRENRLATLVRVRELFDRVADFSVF